MNTDSHDWLTLHRVRFPSAVSALERSFEVPVLPECWRFCPGFHLGPNDLPTLVSDTWCGLGIYGDRQDAEAMVSAPQQHIPWTSEAVEQWHALLMPFAHRGEVNWRGSVQEGCAIRVSSKRLNGPLVVITSAGYDARNNANYLSRASRFSRGIQSVLDFFDGVEDSIRHDVFTGGAFNGTDARDGFTVSLWRDERMMIKAAYSNGQHRTVIDASRDGTYFDRSSFTRAIMISSNGSWNGDPSLEMQ